MSLTARFERIDIGNNIDFRRNFHVMARVVVTAVLYFDHETYPALFGRFNTGRIRSVSIWA
jgi:hypothetical protein